MNNIKETDMSIITNEFLKSYSERIQEKKEEHDEEQVTFKKY